MQSAVVTHGLGIAFGLMVAMVALVSAARRLRVAYPVVLVLGGLALGFIPGLPRIEMQPDLVLLVFLPPLLYHEAVTLSWRDLRANARSVSLLAIGLVVATTAAVAGIGHQWIRGLTWPAAMVLGAIVAPTDEVAVSALAEGMRLPRRVMTVIEGESLVNDAVSLVLYRRAVAAVASGSFLVGRIGLETLWAGIGGIAAGLAIGAVIVRFRRWLDGDPPVENTIGLLTPFAVYLPAEAVGVSGVLAVVAAGLYVGRQNARLVSSETRLQATAMWEMIAFLLNGLLFVLVGLQLNPILSGVAGRSGMELIRDAALLGAGLIAVRIAWVFPAAYLPRWLLPRLRARDPYPDWEQVSLTAWAGMRGGTSLAAALAIPIVTRSGAPFPGRQLIVFLTFGAILSTLVIQGLTLPLLVRVLGVRGEGWGREEARARLEATRAAMRHLEDASSDPGLPREWIDDLRGHYRNRHERLSARLGDSVDDAGADAYRRLKRELLKTERRAIIDLRDRGEIGDDALRAVQRDLDLQAEQLGDDEEE